MKKIPVCIGYELGGKVLEDFPFTSYLDDCKPVYTYLEGWSKDVGGCRRLEDLPPAAISYVRFIEEQVGCPIKYISVGPEREQYIAL